MPFPAGPQKDVVHGDSKSNSHAFDSPPLVLACAIAIWFARWVIPAESSTMGETLWIVFLWIILSLVYVYSKYRERIALEKITPWEIGLGVVVLGQCLGCAGVWMNGGNLRSAVNGCWEWIGVGLSTSMMLRLLNTSLLRARFITVLMTFLVILSGLGIWQHYVWYPKTAAHFRELFNAVFDQLYRIGASLGFGARAHNSDVGAPNLFNNLKLHSVTPGPGRVSYAVRMVRRTVRTSRAKLHALTSGAAGTKSQAEFEPFLSHFVTDVMLAGEFPFADVESLVL